MRLDQHMREVAERAAAAFVLRVAGAGLNFGFTVLLARLVGAEGAGVYFLALTVTTIATVIGRLGLDNAALRHVATAAAVEDWEKVAGVCKQSTRLTLLASATLAIVVFILAPWLARQVFDVPELIVPLRLMTLAVVPFSLLNVYSQFLKAVKRTALATAVQGVGVPLISLGLLAALALVDVRVEWVALIYVISTASVLIWAMLGWGRTVPGIRGVEGRFDRNQLLATSMPLLWVASMNLLMTWTDTIMLGILANSESVGLYNAAGRTALLTSFILSAVNSIAAPKFAAMYAQGELSELSSLARRTACMMALLASPVVMVFVLWPEQVLGLFGAEFEQAAPALLILAVGQFINVATGSVGAILMMTGHEKLMRNNIVFAGLLNIGLNGALIPIYGIEGAAFATAFSIVAMNLVSSVLVYWKIGFVVLPYPSGGFPYGK